MKHPTAAHLENAEINRSAKVFLLPIPMKINNEREIVRRATREVDPPIRLSRKIDWIDVALCAVCGIAVIGYLLLDFGWLDFLVK